MEHERTYDCNVRLAPNCIGSKNDLIALLYRKDTEERLRIARDLHDHVGQILAIVRLHLDSLAKDVIGTDYFKKIKVITDFVDVAEQDVARIIQNLRPIGLDDFGLEVAISNMISDWSQATEIDVEFKHSQQPRSNSTDAEVAIFRVCQEAMTNVARHAKNVNKVKVELCCSTEFISVLISDDGCGFDPDHLSGSSVERNHNGIIGMAERLALLGGEFWVKSGIGEGTTIFARIDLER